MIRHPWEMCLCGLCLRSGHGGQVFVCQGCRDTMSPAAWLRQRFTFPQSWRGVPGQVLAGLGSPAASPWPVDGASSPCPPGLPSAVSAWRRAPAGPWKWRLEPPGLRGTDRGLGARPAAAPAETMQRPGQRLGGTGVACSAAARGLDRSKPLHRRPEPPRTSRALPLPVLPPWMRTSPLQSPPTSESRVRKGRQRAVWPCLHVT